MTTRNGKECFDSARALADGDCDLAKTGLSAERLLNILTLRIGQLLMRWDISPDEPFGEGAGGMSGKEASPFSVMAKKARILQGLSRSVLAIHRIQSHSARDKRESARSSPNSHENPAVPGAPAPKYPLPSHLPAVVKSCAEQQANAAPNVSLKSAFRTSHVGPGASSKILSGPIAPPSIPLILTHTLFKPDRDLNEILKAI